MSSKEDIFWQLEGLRQFCKRRSQSGCLDAGLSPGSALMFVVENAVMLDACTSRYTRGFQGVSRTGSKDGNRQLGPKGDANLRLERMREDVKAVRVQGVCVRAQQTGVCAS